MEKFVYFSSTYSYLALLSFYSFCALGIPSRECISPLLTSATWGFYLIDAQSQKILYEHNAHKLFIPASVTKLFTAVAALEVLGTHYQFKTSVQADALPDKQGIIHGNIYLVGSGDPTLTSGNLQAMAQQLAQQGVTKVKGAVYADNSLFHGTSLPLYETISDLSTRWAPEQSALSVDDNLLQIIVQPAGKHLKPAGVKLQQKVPYAKIINRVTTDARVKIPSIVVERSLDTTSVKVSGVIPFRNELISLWIPVYQPAEYARRIFIQALREYGIVINNHAVRRQQQNDRIELLVHESALLTDILRRMNKTSSNLIADLVHKMVLRQCGSGLCEQSPLVDYCNSVKGKCSLYDGSGFSRDNVLTPAQVVHFLSLLKNVEYKDLFMEFLPEAGVDGTLKKRLEGLPRGLIMRAKTGNLRGIANLAGFITTPSGKELIFAAFINHADALGYQTKDVLDRLVVCVINKYLKQYEPVGSENPVMKRNHKKSSATMKRKQRAIKK